MTTYYCNYQDGNDSNNGLGPDASHATNKPFKTVNKILGTSGVGVAGDTIYLAPVMFREAIVINITSPASAITLIGDYQNAQGFKTSAGVLLPGGLVNWTNYVTNDYTAPSAGNLDLNGRDNLTFQWINWYTGGSFRTILGFNSPPSTGITFEDCTFEHWGVGGASQIMNFVGAADTALNLILRRCKGLNHTSNGVSAITITLPTSASADYDASVLIRDCDIDSGGTAVNVAPSGAGSFKGGGVDVIGGHLRGDVGMQANGANLSTSIPCTITNCVVLARSTGLQATTTGQLIEDYNRIRANTARTNVTAGANSLSDDSQALMLEIGQSQKNGLAPRPYLSPMAGSPLLGFGNGSGGGNSASTVDLHGRPRPAGGGAATTQATETGTATAGAATTLTDSGKSWTTNAFAGYTVKITSGTGSGQQRVVTSNTATVLTVPTWTTNPDNTSVYTIYQRGIDGAVGAYERHDTEVVETSTTQAGAKARKIIGPGDRDIRIPVDASSTSISVYLRYDSNHGTTNKPQAILLANGEIGVATETKTATVGVDTWEQITFTSFTPTAKGTVTVRITSRAAAGNGVLYFDTFAGGANTTAGLDYDRMGEVLDVAVAGGSGGGLIGGGALTGGTQ